MDVLRTPDERFNALSGWDHEPRYVDAGGVRVHYVDAGPQNAPPVLMLHGEPTWSYLYRDVIAPVVAAGHRVVAPDLVGFGRSDKPARVEDHTYLRHVEWMGVVLRALDLRRVTLLGQDWGGLIGLRLVAAEPERFAAVVAANTGLPTGDHPLPDVWWRFREWVAGADELPVSFLVNAGCATELTDGVLRAYDAPFPDESFKAGPRALPLLVPTTPEDPAAPAQRAAWEVLAGWAKPFVCAYSDGDPITRDAGPLFQQVVAGAAGRDHPTIRGAAHFLQEDAPDALARAVLAVAADV